MSGARARTFMPYLMILAGFVLGAGAVALWHARNAIQRRPRENVIIAVNELVARVNNLAPGETGSEQALDRLSSLDARGLLKTPDNADLPALCDAVIRGDATADQAMKLDTLAEAIGRAHAFTDLDAVAERPVVKWAMITHPITLARLPDTGALRLVDHLCRAQLAQAWRRGDWELVLAFQRRSLGLAQICIRQPFATLHVFGLQAFLHNNALIRGLLNASIPPEPTLAQIQANISQFAVPALEAPAELIRLTAVDSFRQSNERVGISEIHAGLHEPALDEFFRKAARQVGVASWTEPDPAALTDKPSREIAELLVRDLVILHRAQAAILADQPATLAVLAVERDRLRTGALPAALKDIPAAILSAKPEDPWTRSPIVYRVVPERSVLAPRGYILYTLGPDGVDQNGHIADQAFPTLDQMPGVDWVYTAAPRAGSPARPNPALDFR